MFSPTRDGEKANNHHSNITKCCSNTTTTTTTDTRRATMEEVWKDINLASLPDNSSLPGTPSVRVYRPHPTSTTTANSSSAAAAAANFRTVILQDFLARPFGNDPPPPPPPTTAPSTALYGDPPSTTASAALRPPPATALSLNSSGPEFLHLLDSSDPLRGSDHSHLQTDDHISNVVASFTSPFDALASSSGLPSFGKKRFPEPETGSGVGDRRHKRMIKNRESAARSRARKQAYTNELELEVAHLMEENAKLRRQQEQYCQAAAAQLPKKHTLQRTSTAPF